MTSEASEIAAESLRLEQARSRCPKAEALERDLRELLDRADIDQDQAKKKELSMLLLGVTLIASGRDIRPDEDEYARGRMKEVGGH